MKLKELSKHLKLKAVAGDFDKTINSIVFDSRQVQAGSLFVAVRGTQTDGHQYIDKAVQQGAVAVIGEHTVGDIPSGVTFLEVDNSHRALGLVSAAFYGHPSRQLRLVGVTGTNGKTTMVNLLYQLFTDLGYRVGVLSTVGNRIGTQSLPATHTTPDAVSINALLADMVAAGCDYAFMEVSSHAVHQERIAGLEFAGGVFTNITHDHLDYHGTFKAYIEAKKAFFDTLPKSAFALVNVDDKRGRVMVQNTKARVHRFSLSGLAEFRARILENSITGLHLEIDGQEFYGRLVGAFNAYNLLAVYAVAVLLGQDRMEVLTALSNLTAAEGRMEYVFDEKSGVTAIVDYAHTPDALEKVLETLVELRKPGSRIITVVGCGGDRDRTKRPKMAHIAATLSNEVILTSDNPRSEDPMEILREMEKGIPAGSTKTVLTQVDRRMAIRTAIRLAKAGDIVLVAGKGHEKYQEIKGVKHPFDDKEILKEEFRG
ncbi:MAG: UDP-N-acetylmuramoyl-L-alanyl-D-glutamate--2,6-diaminopimelate ligase [Saprospiraceae bacterium]